MTGAEPRPPPAASRSLLTGAGMLASARYVVAALGWAGTAIVARRLSGPEFGAFTTVFSLLGLVGLLSELRMSRLVLSAIGDADDEAAGRVIGSYTALRVLVGVAGWAAAMAVVTIGDFDPEVVRATALAGSILVLMSAWYALVLLFQARMWLRSVALSQIVGQAIQLLLTIAVAAAGLATTVWFSMPAVVNAVVGLVWVVFALRRVVRVRLAVDLSTWWTWIKEAAPLSLGYALETAYFRIDVLMLSVMSATLTPVGLYGIGYKFSDLVGSLPVALLGPALALMIDAWSTDPGRFHRTFRTTLVVLFLVAVGVGVGFAVFAEEAIRLLYGDRYAVAAGAARLLVLGQVLHFFTSLCFTTLVAAGRNRLYPVAALSGVVVNVGLNLLLIPRHSYRGSAIATIITEVTVLAVLLSGVARVPAVRPLPWRALGRITLAGMVLAAALAGLRPVVAWPILAAAAPVGYLLMLHMLAIDGPGGLRALAHNARLEMLGRTEDDGPDSDAAPGDEAHPLEGVSGGPGDEPDPPRATAPPSVSGGSDGGPAHRPLRLVAISPHALVSGAEVVLLRTLRAAADAGWDVHCACPEGPLAERLREQGITRDDIPDLRLPAGPRLFGMAAVLLRSVRAAVRMRQVTDGFDVVLVNGLHALVALRVARLHVPTAWLVHDVIVRRDRLAFLRMGVPAVDLAIAVSEAAARPLPKRGVRTVVVRNGTPWPVDPARPQRTDPTVIGCNAVLTPWKGQDVLLEALALLNRDDVVLELVGATLPKDGRYAASLRARAARPDLAGRVRFLGHVEDPLDVMRDWAVAVCPSVDPEAVSLGVLEAMSIGVPVIGTDHGGIPEFLDSAGLLVRPRDPAELATEIRRLLDDEDLRSRCRVAGPVTVAASLTIVEQQRRLLDALADLAASARVRHSGTIVFAVPDYEPTIGGTTRQTDNQARALLRRGHEVTVVTQRLERRWPPAEKTMGLRIRRLRPTGRTSLRMKGYVLSTAWWLRRHRAEIKAVHVLMYPDLAVAAVLAGLGDRTVMCWAGLGDATDTVAPHGGPIGRALRSARLRALTSVAHVALTPALADELARLGLDRDVTVIPTPVDTTRFRPPSPAERDEARRSLGVGDDTLAVVYTGHLRALKRVDALVDAFAPLVADGRRAMLFIVGGSRHDLDDRSESLHRQVHNLGLDATVRFTGAVPAVEPYLHAADIFVLPSEREGLPNSIVEAMACGLPVVAPPSAGGDQVLDPTCGVVPADNDPANLFSAIAELADDPDRRRALGAAAREAASRYSLPEVVDRCEELYARLAAGRASPDCDSAPTDGEKRADRPC